jgi:hypothetical protein
MQPSRSVDSISPSQPPWGRSAPVELWLEEEDPDELKKVEELKGKQKALEKELAEKRKRQQEQKEPAAGAAR